MFSGSDNINKTNVTPSPDAKLRSEDWHLFARMLSGAAYCQISISRSGPSDVRLKKESGEMEWRFAVLRWALWDCGTVGGQAVGGGRQTAGWWVEASQAVVSVRQSTGATPQSGTWGTPTPSSSTQCQQSAGVSSSESQTGIASLTRGGLRVAVRLAGGTHNTGVSWPTLSWWHHCTAVHTTTTRDTLTL